MRTFPGWGTMAWWLNNGSANYNSLQVLFKTQIQKLQFQAAYTWGHSIGDITQQNSSGGLELGCVHLGCQTPAWIAATRRSTVRRSLWPMLCTTCLT